MLQQTQVERVKVFYEVWFKKFPTVRALARASLGDVLKVWQGLGYNRRAKMLHEAAKTLLNEAVFTGSKNTRLDLVKRLECLPGVGPYTARAVCAFAYNQDVVFVETNIRTAVIYHFYSSKNNSTYETVSDPDILRMLELVFPKGRSREWYAALMDYGAHLKRSGVRLNAKTKNYTKQSAFIGSARQARGVLLKELSHAPASSSRLIGLLGDNRKEELRMQLARLVNEGMIEKLAKKYRLPE